MIEITHISDEGTVAWGVPKNDEPAAVLQAAGWCWSRRLAAWHLPGSRYQAASILHVDEAAAALQAAGFQVSLRIDDEPTQRRYSLKMVDDQILHLEGKLSKVNRLLGQHFRTIAVEGQTSAATDLWAIRMLLRRIDLEERLRHWREVGDRLTEGTPAHSAGMVRNSGTDPAPLHDTTGHRHADDLDGPLP
ncbi:hypothetical protein EV651_1017 [Kribbella sp. VKM Ac-2571]|uniref:hypothetical protein n=1 Tax=Kribbella sp. VKM Ac-2571 TaxID=2512222 RepID=UPI00105D9248|nr:hypothetical protein [Kribbella sp. VKM Ac-2571]TDO68973.1 hypothetical protein EV651_1017 [Kribbella sp. VKM Ac-2571]